MTDYQKNEYIDSFLFTKTNFFPITAFYKEFKGNMKKELKDWYIEFTIYIIVHLSNPFSWEEQAIEEINDLIDSYWGRQLYW